MRVNKRKMADDRIEQIISSLKVKNKDALNALFSNKALSESNDFDDEVDRLFEFMKGNITSWKREGGVDSDESAEQGKKSLMLRYSILISTDIDDYCVFVIDYNTDTIDKDNEGIYMLEISKQSYHGDWAPWQERMFPGISIIEWYEDN